MAKHRNGTKKTIPTPSRPVATPPAAPLYTDDEIATGEWRLVAAPPVVVAPPPPPPTLAELTKLAHIAAVKKDDAATTRKHEELRRNIVDDIHLAPVPMCGLDDVDNYRRLRCFEQEYRLPLQYLHEQATRGDMSTSRHESYAHFVRVAAKHSTAY